MHTPTHSARGGTAATPEAPAHPGYVLLISLVAAFGGFLFGYDTAVVSGAIGFLQERFQLDAGLTGWAASSMLVGCMAGAAMGGVLGDRLGRRPSLILCAAAFALSSLASAAPDSLAPFAWARFAGGLAIGAASILSPLYIAEIAPGRFRGRLVSLYQLAIVIGILAVFFVNLQIQRAGDHAWNVAAGWRWMFASLAAPSVVFGVLLLLVPESPRWLMARGRAEAARGILERIDGGEAARAELAAIAASLREEQGRWSELWQAGPRRALLIGVVLAIGQQFSGINAIMYYAPEIFKAAGATTDAAFVQTVTVGAINLACTFVAIAAVDRLGRRPLLLAGGAAQAAALTLVSVAFASGGGGVALQIGVLAFVAAFAMAMGPVTWIVIAEIFPNRLRGRAMALAVTVLWLACFAVSQTFPMLLAGVGPAATFAAYAACSAATVLFVWRRVPETKARSLEQIEAEWRR